MSSRESETARPFYIAGLIDAFSSSAVTADIWFKTKPIMEEEEGGGNVAAQENYTLKWLVKRLR